MAGRLGSSLTGGAAGAAGCGLGVGWVPAVAGLAESIGALGGAVAERIGELPEAPAHVRQLERFLPTDAHTRARTRNASAHGMSLCRSKPAML